MPPALTRDVDSSLDLEAVEAHPPVSTLGLNMFWSSWLSPGSQPGQMAHLGCPRTISSACLPALNPSSMANKVKSSLGSKGM